MSIQILRRGSRGQEVVRWQQFLVGQGFLRGVADGCFGELTDKATRAFQHSRGVAGDGIVGPRTLASALIVGFDPGFEDPLDEAENPLLAGRSPLEPLSDAGRRALFGEYEFEAAGSPQNPERVKVIGDWERRNIKTVVIPQLRGVPVFGRYSSGRMRFHRAGETQLKGLWSAWEREGLLENVLSYDGAHNPRFLRGSRDTLSTHAFGIAFDINARWNRLGALPAKAGETGSVRELVGLANEYGFFWGGHFRERPDAMHFELAKLL
ncbi:M15 family metallopeptidase [Endothiovibrio diazotrophicus]